MFTTSHVLVMVAILVLCAQVVRSMRMEALDECMARLLKGGVVKKIHHHYPDPLGDLESVTFHVGDARYQLIDFYCWKSEPPLDLAPLSRFWVSEIGASVGRLGKKFRLTHSPGNWDRILEVQTS